MTGTDLAEVPSDNLDLRDQLPVQPLPSVIWNCCLAGIAHAGSGTAALSAPAVMREFTRKKVNAF
jgi:hypothetical protein